MPDQAALLAEQARLRPMLDRLLALAALWADPPGAASAAATNAMPAAAAMAATAGAGAAPTSNPPEPGAHADAPNAPEPAAAAVSADRPAPPAMAPSSWPLPAAATGRPIALPASAPSSTLARRTPGASTTRQRPAAASSPSTSPTTVSAGASPAWPVARLPAPRGGGVTTRAAPPARTPFAALAATTALAEPPMEQATSTRGGSETGEAMPAPLRRPLVMTAGDAGAAPDAVRAAFGTPPAIAAMPAGAMGMLAAAGAEPGVPRESTAPWRDGLEDQLADLLERAAAEAGVALP